MLFCGLDVGTTGVKALVFDEKGTPLADAYRPYNIQVESDGTRLLKAEELWTKTKQAFAEAALKAPGKITALCADSFGEAFVCLDAAGEIICDPMLFTDRWGEKEYFEAEKKTSAEEIAGVCGLPLSPSYSLSKVLYLKEQRPDIYERIDKILLIQDFINYKLCGNTAADYSTACRTMFFDVRNCSWSGELLSRFGLEKAHYSAPVPMGTVIGTLKKELAEELGLDLRPTDGRSADGGIKIVVGGHDQPVNAIGSGLRKGYAVNSMGTSECITPIMSGILPADFIAHKGIPSEPLWARGKFCCLAYNVSSGLLVQWFASVSSGEKEPSLSFFDENVPPKPTKIMVQPYLMGSGTPYMDSGARLAITGMDYGTSRFDIYRAILEALVLDQKLNLEVLAQEQVTVDHLIAVGGGSKSKPWLKIKADILQIPVSTLKVKEAGALGCAVLCAAAQGIYGSVEEAAQNMSQIGITIEPDSVYNAFYGEKFAVYRELHDHVKAESAFAVKMV
jgi:xylulokinase